MQNRPTRGLRNRNRIQYGTTADGSDTFREYWIHEWDGKGYDVHVHIKDLEQAIYQALALGYIKDAEKLEQLRRANS